jgi:hypothetical protein
VPLMPPSRIGRPTAKRSSSPPCGGAGCSRYASSRPAAETWKSSPPGRTPRGRPTHARSCLPADPGENVFYRYLTCLPNESRLCRVAFRATVPKRLGANEARQLTSKP